MGRIKQGLDYFPLNTDFMHDRVVRRVMKREGDSAFTILLYTLSYLYSGEGYYIHVMMTSMTNSPTSSSARITIVSAGCFVCLWSTVSSIPLSTNVTAS